MLAGGLLATQTDWNKLLENGKLRGLPLQCHPYQEIAGPIEGLIGMVVYNPFIKPAIS